MPRKLSKKDLVVVSKEKAYWMSVKEITKIEITRLENKLRSAEQEVIDFSKCIKLQQGLIEHSDYKIKGCDY